MRKIFNKYNLFINVYISLIINVVLSIILPLVSVGMLNFRIFITGFLIAFPISTLLVLFIPLNLLGDHLAGKAGLKKGSVGFRLFSTLILSFILSVVMSLIMTAVNVGTGLPFIPAWKHVFWYVFASVYVSAVFGSFTAFPLAIKLMGPPDDK